MIRQYTPKDQPSLVAILRMHIPAFFHPSEEADLIDYLEHKTEDYFVIEAKGSVVGGGGINCNLSEKRAFISWDFIHPDYLGQGLGKQLLFHRIDHIRSMYPAFLIAVRTSQMSFQFYEKLGFNLEFINKDFWAEGYDMYYMTWKDK